MKNTDSPRFKFASITMLVLGISLVMCCLFGCTSSKSAQVFGNPDQDKCAAYY